MLMLRSALLLVTCAVCSYSCKADCDEDACNAADSRHRSARIKQGVTGVIAYQTDACEQSCCQCSWADAELTLWHSDEPVNEGVGLRLVASGDPALSFRAEREYGQALDPGDHMLCFTDTCAALHIEPGDVFTVNVQLVYGPAQLIVYGPNDRAPRDDLVFSVNKE